MGGDTFRGFFLVDATWNIIYLNDALKQALGIAYGPHTPRWPLEKLLKVLGCSISPRQLAVDLRRAGSKPVEYQGGVSAERQGWRVVMEAVSVKAKVALVGLIYEMGAPRHLSVVEGGNGSLVQWAVEGLREGFFVVEARSKIIVYANETFHFKRGLRPPLAIGKPCYQAVRGLMDPCTSLGQTCPLEFMDPEGRHAFCPNGDGNTNDMPVVRLTPLRQEGEGLYVVGMEWADSHKAWGEGAGRKVSRVGDRAKIRNAPSYERLQHVVSEATRAPTLSSLLAGLSQAVRQDVGPVDVVFVLPDAAGKDHLIFCEPSTVAPQALQNLKNLLVEANRTGRVFERLRRGLSNGQSAEAAETLREILRRWAAPRYVVHFGLLNALPNGSPRALGVYVGLSDTVKALSQDVRSYMDTLFSLTSEAINRLVMEETAVASPSFHDVVLTNRDGIIGCSKEMREVNELIDLVAASDATVLITGENGTGKELVAHAIHNRSHRKKGPFVVAHCSAYSPTLLESELFGHEKGAFTGAIRQKKGRVERAQGGTLFLDEIGDIAPATQVLLLRFLQDHRFERVGGESTLQADVRVLAATNRNLIKEVENGRFRDDLYYRLNVISIHLPPLRDRKEDIPHLSHYFLKKYSAKEGKTVSGFSSGALQTLMDYDWPGNVRQLENAISHAVILAQEDTIRRQHLPRFLVHAHEAAPTASLIENEKRLILQVLRQTQWNKHEAARKLQVSRSTLYSKIQRYGLRPEGSA
ncbi:regulatory Fis family protein [Desulfosoma caldarium]|uniref:Regulatory Fis family protein n=2 Tax=Desulfosoma caldarium TaxID=610254 RepID=A0A3N1UZX4_9BACT|nr:regulatory Fis family protein [Desulfosoma caldarium]